MKTMAIIFNHFEHFLNHEPSLKAQGFIIGPRYATAEEDDQEPVLTDAAHPTLPTHPKVWKLPFLPF